MKWHKSKRTRADASEGKQGSPSCRGKSRPASEQCPPGDHDKNAAVSWARLGVDLDGLPPEERRIVGQRLDLPRRYTAALASTLTLRWRITFWPANALILLPHVLWDEAIKRLRVELCERIGATSSTFATLVMQEVADCAFDAKKRLYLPTRLYGHLDFANRPDQVIVRTGAAWLEIWPQAFFDQEFQKALADVKAILSARNYPPRSIENRAIPTTVAKSCGPIVTDRRGGLDGKSEVADDNTVGS